MRRLSILLGLVFFAFIVFSQTGAEAVNKTFAERFAGGPPVGAKSHARVNEIGVLYTAVAGMLNLLAMIDAAHRAAREPE